MATRRQFGPYRPRRPFREGLVDGDDVWPPLCLEDLRFLAGIDHEQERRERTGNYHSRRAADEAGGAIYSFAERVRHYRDLVAGLEAGVAHDYEPLAELNCREIVDSHLAKLPS